MTELEINITIAKSLGYMDIYRCGQSGKRTEQGMLNGKLLCGTLDQPSINYGREYVFIKRYTADLNACHEFEKTLDDDLDLDYSENLESVTGTRWGANNSYDMSKYRSATARQRCEAYLKTIRKWIE
jgi:hypothetical protein